MTIGERLQVDRHSPAVKSGVRPIGADKRRETLHRRIGEDDLRDFLLLLGHRLK